MPEKSQSWLQTEWLQNWRSECHHQSRNTRKFAARTARTSERSTTWRRDAITKKRSIRHLRSTESTRDCAESVDAAVRLPPYGSRTTACPRRAEASSLEWRCSSISSMSTGLGETPRLLSLRCCRPACTIKARRYRISARRPQADGLGRARDRCHVLCTGKLKYLLDVECDEEFVVQDKTALAGEQAVRRSGKS